MLTTYPSASIDVFIVAWRNSIGSKVGARRLSQVKPWLGPVIDRLGEPLACAADQCLAAEALGSARLLPSRGGSTTKGGAICRCRAGRRTGTGLGVARPWQDLAVWPLCSPSCGPSRPIRVLVAQPPSAGACCSLTPFRPLRMVRPLRVGLLHSKADSWQILAAN